MGFIQEIDIAPKIKDKILYGFSFNLEIKD